MLLGASGLVRRGLAVALFAWLAWRGGAGALELAERVSLNRAIWTDAFRLTQEQRLASTLGGWDEDHRLARGYLHALVRAIQEQVPAHETVQVVGMRERKQLLAFIPVPHLCFPRKLGTDLIPLPPDWEPDEPSYLLLFDARLRERLQAKKTLLAAGPDWTLWH
jgi:hypothetical protein